MGLLKKIVKTASKVATAPYKAIAKPFQPAKTTPVPSPDVAADPLKKAVAQFEAIGIPTAEAQKLALQRISQVGELTPQQQVTTGLAGVQVDPTLMAAQRGALAKLQEISAAGGLTPADKAQLAQIESDQKRVEQGQRGAIIQSAQTHGMGTAGTTFAAKLGAQQEAANRASSSGLDVAKMAQDRALQAVLNQGNLAGNIRSQDYTQAADTARAQDEINRFNTANTIAASEKNLSEKQRVSEVNAGAADEEARAAAALPGTTFNQQIQKASGMGGAYNAISNLAAQQAANIQAQNEAAKQRRNQTLGSVLGTAGTIGAAFV